MVVITKKINKKVRTKLIAIPDDTLKLYCTPHSLCLCLDEFSCTQCFLQNPKSENLGKLLWNAPCIVYHYWLLSGAQGRCWIDVVILER